MSTYHTSLCFNQHASCKNNRITAESEISCPISIRHRHCGNHHSKEKVYRRSMKSFSEMPANPRSATKRTKKWKDVHMNLEAKIFFLRPSTRNQRRFLHLTGSWPPASMMIRVSDRLLIRPPKECLQVPMKLRTETYAVRKRLNTDYKYVDQIS